MEGSIIAQHDYNLCGKTRRASGFTLIEVLVVISIISMLMAIILPVISKVKQQAKRTTCRANLHAAAIGFKMYLDEYRDYMPPASSFPTLDPKKPSISVFLEPYLSDKRSLKCPADVPDPDRIDQPGKRYYETEKTSYQYKFQLGNKRIKDFLVDKATSRRRPQKIEERNLEILNDYRPVHGDVPKEGKKTDTKATNYLYADLHVGGAEKQ